MKIFFILLLLTSMCIAETPTPPTSENVIKYWTTGIQKAEEAVKNATEFSKYEKLKFKNKDKNINLSELSEVDKKIFIFYKCEEISFSLFIMQNELEKKEDVNEKEKQELLNKIFSLRKIHVSNFEKFVEKAFAEDKDLSDIDKKKYLSRINEWHTKNMKEKK